MSESGAGTDVLGMSTGEEMIESIRLRKNYHILNEVVIISL